MGGSWSGAGFLEQIDGSIEDFPPIRVLFMLNRLKSTGCLSIQHQQELVIVQVRNGAVVGCQGVPRLLASLGVSGSADSDLMGLVGMAIAGGSPPDVALNAAAAGLGDVLANMVGMTKGHVLFENELQPSNAPITLPVPLPRIISSGLRRSRTALFVQQRTATMRHHVMLLSLPDDSLIDSWGLDPVALRLLRVARKNADRKPTVSQLLRKGGCEHWQALDLLLQLGLVQLEPPRKLAPRPPRVVSAREPEPEVDPVAELRAELDLLRTTTPWVVLGLKLANDVSDEGIDRANRTVSKRYHPDGFVNQTRPLRKLASECFNIVQNAYNTMKDETLRMEVRARLAAEEKGEQYVADRDRQEAEMVYARAQVLFRKKDYRAAKKAFDHANQLDPVNWRYKYMQIRTDYHLGAVTGNVSVEQILALSGPRGHTMADVTYEAAEILAREKKEGRAFELHKKVLSLNPEHIGARRRVRMRQKRKAEDNKSGSGLFSGLFRRKKK